MSSSVPTMPGSLNRVVITHYVNAVVGALVGLGYMIFGIIGLLEGSDEGIMMGVFMLISGFFAMVLSLVLHLLAARGLKRMSNAWRIVSIVLSILGLSSIPLGTVLGIIALTGLFAEDTKQAFEAAKK